MRPKPRTILLLFALSSFAFAQYTSLDSSSVSGKIAGAMPSGLSCLTDLKGAIPAIMVLAMGINMFYQAKTSGGSSAAAMLGSIMGLAIVITAAMNGGLCKGNAMMYIVAFSILQMIMEKSVSEKGGIKGTIYLMVSVYGFQYILSNPNMMNNPSMLIGYLIGQLILFSILEGFGTASSIGFGAVGLGKWALEGIKGLKKGPKGEETGKEVENEIKPKLIQLQNYVVKAEKEANDAINSQIKKAKNYGKYEKKILRLKGKKGKIEELLFKDSKELIDLSNDLQRDIELISKDTENIKVFQEGLRTSLGKINTKVTDFVEHVKKREFELFARDAGQEATRIRAEEAEAKEIEKELAEEMSLITKGMVYFAKLSVFTYVMENLLAKIKKCLGETGTTLKKEAKNTEKEIKESKKKGKDASKQYKK